MEVMDFTINCIVSCPILVSFYCVLVLVFVCTISLSAKTIVFVVNVVKLLFHTICLWRILGDSEPI